MTKPSISDWLERCSAAQQAGSPWPEASLFRQVIDYPDWSVSASHEDAYTADAAPGAAGVSLEPSDGLALAAAAGGGVRLHYAPGAPPLTLDAEQVAHLQRFVQISVVEKVLALLHAGAEMPLKEPCARLRDYCDYFVVQQGSMLALAPDSSSRRLAAAFTAEDALQLFVASSAASGAELVAIRLTGVELFGKLADVDLDGVVFNPAGPIQPVPLLKAVAAHVLSAP